MKMESLITIGIILLFIGIMFIIIGSLSQSGKTDVKSAGIIFIGPFPMGWASDKKMFYILIGLTILTFITWFLLRKYL